MRRDGLLSPESVQAALAPGYASPWGRGRAVAVIVICPASRRRPTGGGPVGERIGFKH